MKGKAMRKTLLALVAVATLAISALVAPALPTPSVGSAPVWRPA